jgi:hypothetical protein
MNDIAGVDTPMLQLERPRGKRILPAALLLAMVSTLAGVGQAQTVADADASHGARPRSTYVVLDTLGTATPTTKFSVFGSGGNGIFSEQFIGPQFTLPRRSVLTQVGGFVNNCDSILSGVPQCPNTRPFVVQIRRSVNGAPDPRLVVAAAPLTHDNDPLVVSFESARFDAIPLEAGTYFAIFTPQQAGDAGFLIGSALGYAPGITAVGTITPAGSTFDAAAHTAVRIVARPVRR